jgi:hypothetical protein
VAGLNTFDLGEIAEALQDQNDFEHVSLVNADTGEMVYWTEDTGIDGHTPIDIDDLDEALVSIRPLPSSDWYRDMADFVDEVSDEVTARRLARAIDGKGAFRRFRAELHEEYPNLLPVWLEFRDVRAKRRAAEWLADNDLISDDEYRRYLDSHPDPHVP